MIHIINNCLNYIVSFGNYFMAYEWIQAVILLGGFSYAVGVIFLPLLVQDILIGAISHKASERIWKCQFIPIVNFILFVSIFVWIIFKLIWWCVKRIVWNIIHLADYEKYYKEIVIPKKYKLPKHLQKENNKNK